MKGLEEELENEEKELLFQANVITYLTIIVFSTASLVKEILSYVYDKATDTSAE